MRLIIQSFNEHVRELSLMHRATGSQYFIHVNIYISKGSDVLKNTPLFNHRNKTSLTTPEYCYFLSLFTVETEQCPIVMTNASTRFDKHEQYSVIKQKVTGDNLSVAKSIPLY